MICKKCNVEIPSHFEYMIAQNICGKCGSKLMLPLAMKIFLDLKKRLNDEVEFVMDKQMVCERVAMFVVSNYEVHPIGGKLATETINTTNAKIKAQDVVIASLEQDDDMTAEEIRQQEASRAEDIAAAREMGLNIDELGDDEEFVSQVDDDRVERRKRLAAQVKTGVGVIKRVS